MKVLPKCDPDPLADWDWSFWEAMCLIDDAWSFFLLGMIAVCGAIGTGGLAWSMGGNKRSIATSAVIGALMVPLASAAAGALQVSTR